MARYSLLDPVNLRRVHERELAFTELLRDAGVTSIAARDVLEVGCGSGAELARLVALGASPAGLHGIDVSADAIAEARCRVRAVLVVGDASDMPYDDGSFDLVVQLTALSSMRSAEMRAAVAREMRRVLRADGLIVSYDFVWNPTHRDTVGIPRRELERLFPGEVVAGRRVTLAPPVARAARRIPGATPALMRIPWLRSHLLVVIRP